MSTNELLAAFPQPLEPMPLIAVNSGRFKGLEDPGRAFFGQCGKPAESHAGWLLYAGFGHESHAVAQDLSSREGIYWHAIYHRMEPDSWNAKYWFRQCGKHPIHVELAAQARAFGWKTSADWDAALFVDMAGKAIEAQDAAQIELAERVQLLEWRLLFEYGVEGRVK